MYIYTWTCVSYFITHTFLFGIYLKFFLFFCQNHELVHLLLIHDGMSTLEILWFHEQGHILSCTLIWWHIVTAWPATTGLPPKMGDFGIWIDSGITSIFSQFGIRIGIKSLRHAGFGIKIAWNWNQTKNRIDSKIVTLVGIGIIDVESESESKVRLESESESRLTLNRSSLAATKLI